MSFPQYLFGSKMKSNKSTDLVVDKTESSISIFSETTEPAMEIPIHRHFNILSEENTKKLWKDLKSGLFRELTSIKFSFRTNPTRDISKMKHLADVFAAIGTLPHLEELVFYDATLFLPNAIKLLKESSSLHTLKFHHCSFILSARNTKDKNPTHSIEKLWEAIQLQTGLTVLEFIACNCHPFQPLNCDPSTEGSILSLELPTFLEEHTFSKLKRLVLDSWSLDASNPVAFANLIGNNTSLEELEIHPVFETAVVRRQQYQAKKRAVKRFMLETIPATLASNSNSKLKKLVVSVDDYHLNPIYADVMAKWVDLVQHDNHVITDLRATPHPLSTSTKEADFAYGLRKNEWLHCNLQYHLGLNKLRAQGQLSPEDVDQKDLLAGMLPVAYDVSCLHELLKPNPECLDASTQSVPCMEMDDIRTVSTRRGSIL